MKKYRPEQRDAALAMRRGAFGRCPNCGKGKIFTSYLKVAPRCSVCGEDLSHHRADDAPPYFTMLIVGHVVVAGILTCVIETEMPLWSLGVIFGTLTVVLSLVLLPMIKGAIIGLQWANRMHGFSGKADPDSFSPY
ncbi:hypothetical protein C5L14_23785 [Labrys okinawensis]|uniref:DUF983 domain-containing protein n=1 Tax=Labrys okinawensis TaxID=346911 RepID=A0A2S9Q6L0_9HYPH|nr:DUF983 domain-containing protein [Labrys okinawensis]PRH84979.1 hypothetical protein C5L14_23785 [Labrys okinawensis]